MTKQEIVKNVRRLINEPSAAIWSNTDIDAFISGAFRRIRTIDKRLTTTRCPDLTGDLSVPAIPGNGDWDDLFVLFATARCFEQDRQNYPAVKYMNEFETKLNEFINFLDNLTSSDWASAYGETDTSVFDVTTNNTDYVTDEYFNKA
jgi:hypothetical protein